MNEKYKIWILAGEASGDMRGAGLVSIWSGRLRGGIGLSGPIITVPTRGLNPGQNILVWMSRTGNLLPDSPRILPQA